MIFDKNVNLQVCISKGHDFVDQKRLNNYFKNKTSFFVFFCPMKKSLIKIVSYRKQCKAKGN